MGLSTNKGENVLPITNAPERVVNNDTRYITDGKCQLGLIRIIDSATGVLRKRVKSATAAAVFIAYEQKALEVLLEYAKIDKEEGKTITSAELRERLLEMKVALSE